MMITMMMMMITKVMMIIMIEIVIVIAKVMMKTIAKIMTVFNILWFIDWKLHLQNGTLQIVMIIYFVTTKIRDIMMFFGKLCYDFLCSKHCGNGNRMRGK